jgi:hypothetical protein
MLVDFPFSLLVFFFVFGVLVDLSFLFIFFLCVFELFGRPILFYCRMQRRRSMKPSIKLNAGETRWRRVHSIKYFVPELNLFLFRDSRGRITSSPATGMQVHILLSSFCPLFPEFCVYFCFFFLT